MSYLKKWYYDKNEYYYDASTESQRNKIQELKDKIENGADKKELLKETIKEMESLSDEEYISMIYVLRKAFSSAQVLKIYDETPIKKKFVHRLYQASISYKQLKNIVKTALEVEQYKEVEKILQKTKVDRLFALREDNIIDEKQLFKALTCNSTGRKYGTGNLLVDVVLGETNSINKDKCINIILNLKFPPADAQMKEHYDVLDMLIPYNRQDKTYFFIKNYEKRFPEIMDYMLDLMENKSNFDAIKNVYKRLLDSIIPSGINIDKQKDRLIGLANTSDKYLFYFAANKLFGYQNADVEQRIIQSMQKDIDKCHMGPFRDKFAWFNNPNIGFKFNDRFVQKILHENKIVLYVAKHYDIDLKKFDIYWSHDKLRIAKMLNKKVHVKDEEELKYFKKNNALNLLTSESLKPYLDNMLRKNMITKEQYEKLSISEHKSTVTMKTI
jgi:hypothetical protein